ncbi:MAG TPA: acetate--CoA ligase [Pseudonocardiaceae bacterium]|jgi:acetyl-CoA synthetase|nr:acetate--CoA ligase [Pseudonocardiaceae bacterium]
MAENTKLVRNADELEQVLEDLQKIEKFEPPEEFREHARIRDVSVYEAAERDPEGYWAEQARQLHWDQPFSTVLDDSDAPFFKWFADGTLNVSYNCLDRHVEAGRGDRVAYHWRGEEGEERDITYADLHRDVQRLANGLKDQGVQKGDVVGIFLPMIPEVVVAMLACARIGAPHNVVFGGFSPNSVRDRMEISNAKALITVDGARRKGKTAPIKREVDRVMSGLADLKTIVVVRHTRTECDMQDGRDVFYDELLARSEPECPPEPLPAEHPLFILYSSGSTAKPKGIQHTTGGYLTGVATTHRDVFDIRPESDVYWCSADVGWVTGHSYIVYGPLANGCTSVLFEGAPDYPDKDVWWDIVERYGVTIFYTAPTAIRACMKWGVEYPNRHDLSSLRLLGSVGEPINPKAWLWYYEVIGHERCPVVDTWWQTETGHIMIAPLPGVTPAKPGSATLPLPGISASIVDPDGNELAEGTGLLVITRPWPGMLRTLYGDDERYVSTYFDRFGPRTYVAGDAARRDSEGYFWIIGRTDDVINVSGHRLSTAEVESAIVAHDKVAEAAVVAEADELTGQAIVAFITLIGDVQGDDEVEAEIREHVGSSIGKLARPKSIIWADDLPKTRSGKIMRRLLRDITEGRELGDVTTLRDPAVVEELQAKAAARTSTK